MPTRVKSLKYYFRENSIKNEVNRWNFEDCNGYLQKHKRDTSQSNLLKNKLKIVSQRQGTLLHTASIPQLAQYLKTPQLDSNMKKILRGYLSGRLRSVSAQQRGQVFQGWTYHDIVVFLTKLAPKVCCDDSYPNWKKVCTYIGTGVYLWALGYNVKRPLGAGSFGCVWECDGEAVKVIPNNRAAQLEKVSAEKVLQLINKDETGKCKKYFNYLVSTGEHTPVLKAVLASGDLLDAARERVKSNRAESKKSTKTIASLLRQLKQVGKSLVLLHNLGYSHNDVKPQNFLKVEKSILNPDKINVMSKDGKVHKHRTQIADFGGICKIPQTSKEERKRAQIVFTPCYSPKNMLSEYTKEAIEKRDVFALGASGLDLLLSKIPIRKRLPEFRVIIAQSNESIYNNCKLAEYYGGTSKENMFKFLDVIRSMMNESYRSRPTLEKSLEHLKALNP